MYRFVLKHSGRQQLYSLIFVAISWPIGFMLFDVPKQIINRALGGEGPPFSASVLGLFDFVFDGSQTRHEIRGAEHGAQIASIRYESTLETKRATIRELLKRLETGRQRLAIARRRAETASEQQRLADLNLRAERGGLVEALAAREQLSRFEIEAIDAYFDQLELWASLQRELGRLSSEILGSASPRAPTP